VDQELVTVATRLTPDPYSNTMHQTVGIVDANVILSSVVHDCRNDWGSRLLRSTLFGSTTLFAADHVYGEVYKYLPKLARTCGLPVEDLRARFEENYLPAIRFVTVSMPEKLDPQVLAITDLDDRPTGQLALLIAPVIVFSEDKHLRRPGFAPPDWRAAAGHTAVVAEAAGQERVTGVALTFPVTGAWSGSGALGRRLGIPRWMPGVVLVAVLGLGVYRLLQDPVRRAKAMDIGGDVAEKFAERLADQSRLKLAGLAGIGPIIFPAAEEPTARQQVAVVLARSPEPLLATEVHDLVIASFYDDRVPSLREVRTILTEGSEVVRVERYRWQLGREVGPWRGQYH
jgi:hypothetical protein